jgi:hypothetical protein
VWDEWIEECVLLDPNKISFVNNIFFVIFFNFNLFFIFLIFFN